MNLELRLTPLSVKSSAPLSKRKSDVNFPLVLEIVVGGCVVSKREKKKKRKKSTGEVE